MKQTNWEIKLAKEGTPMAEFQKERTDAMSEMFEDVEQNGIYPTSRLYYRLDKMVKHLLEEQNKKLYIPEATESDGWENARTHSCCPGDDWADGWNACKKYVNKLNK